MTTLRSAAAVPFLVLTSCCLLIPSVCSAQLKRPVPTGTSQPADPPLDADKQSVPAAKDLEAAEKQMRDLFRSDLSKAKKADQKGSLAQKLLREAAKVEDDPASQFVLWREAAELATAAGDAAIMRQAVDEIAATFRVDELGLKAEYLKRMGTAAKTPDAAKGLVRHCMDVADEVVVLDRYDVAGELGDIAVGLANRSRTPALQKEVKAWRERLALSAAQWDAAEEARKKLDVDPDDIAANRVLGRYLCFVTRDWKKGLPFLALAGDAELKKAAELDLAAPSDPEKMAVVGEAWADFAQGAKGDDKRSAQIRALDWLRRCVLKLTGGTRTRVEKRIQELDRALGPG
jgi:hypothetical protein